MLDSDSINDETQFTIAVFPDTQFYAENDNGIFEEMGQWVADNQSPYNIQTLFHVGDLVENFGTETSEWEIAADAIGRVTDAGVTPLIAHGNHDNDEFHVRSYSTYQSYFGPDWMASVLDSDPTVIDWDTYSTDGTNSYVIQEINGQRYLWLQVEYGPRDVVMDWALNVFETHSDLTAAYVSHEYLTYDGEFGTDTSHVDDTDANGGLSQWNNWISETSNVKFEIGGHYHSTTDFNDRRTDETATGGEIVSQHVNYQSATANGGDGWLRLLVVDTETDDVAAYTYSPYLDEWDDGAETQYSFSLRTPVWNSAAVQQYRDGEWVDAGVEHFSEAGDGDAVIEIVDNVK